MNYRYFDIAVYENMRRGERIYLINGRAELGIFYNLNDAQRAVDELIENNCELENLVNMGEAIDLIVTDDEKFAKVCDGWMHILLSVGDEQFEIPWDAGVIDAFSEFIEKAIEKIL